MDPVLAGAIGILILFFLLIVLRLPVGAGLALIGFTGFWYLTSAPAALAKLAIVPFSIVSSYGFAVLPLFLLLAEVVIASDFGKDMYYLAAKLVGRYPGGLAMSTVGGSTIFGALTDSTSTMLVMGVSALPEMRRYKYSDVLALGAIMGGACIGTLIPPSGAFIIYGILTGNSIGKLFIAGIIPGLLLTVLDIIVIYFMCRANPNLGPKGPGSTFKEKMTALQDCFEIILLVILVLVGLTFGWFTPTEAGAAGAFGAIVIGFAKRRLTWTALKDAFVRTLEMTGMIYAIVIGAFLFSNFIAVTNLPGWLATLVSEANFSPLGTLALILVVYFLLGTAMDTPTMVMLTIPIFYPLVISLGFDAIWFGVILTVMCEIAELSPPAGLDLYVLKGVVPEVSMLTIWKSAIPFMIVELILVVLLLFFPQLALWLTQVVSW